MKSLFFVAAATIVSITLGTSVYADALGTSVYADVYNSEEKKPEYTSITLTGGSYFAPQQPQQEQQFSQSQSEPEQ
jgi:peptidoglycan biosynthesis protein MviN/MurJ (putative lipid II flippase)